MIATESALENVASYVNGKWEGAGGRPVQPVTNPATGAAIAQVAHASVEDVDRTVQAAHAAWLKWRDVPVVERVQPFYRYKTLLEKHANDLAATLTAENGKTIDDARMEVRRAIQMVEVACGMPSLMMGDSLNDVASGIDSHTIRQPIGVCAGITPFNFPAMVPMWMWPFAIACGNTFVLKPSEKVPMTPAMAAALLHEAGLPDGVFNLIHGDKIAVDALLHHPLVRAVSFVGSTPVAKYIYQTAAAEGKRVQALGGAKNHLGGDARCRYAEERGGHHRLGVRRRRRAMPGRQRAGGGGRRGGSAAEAAGRESERHAGGRWRGEGRRHGAAGHEGTQGARGRLHR